MSPARVGAPKLSQPSWNAADAVRGCDHCVPRSRTRQVSHWMKSQKSLKCRLLGWWRGTESNCRHYDCQSLQQPVSGQFRTVHAVRSVGFLVQKQRSAIAWRFRTFQGLTGFCNPSATPERPERAGSKHGSDQIHSSDDRIDQADE
jgi:hypothetical protein